MKKDIKKNKKNSSKKVNKEVNDNINNDNDDDDNNDNGKSLSSDTIRFLAMLAIRLPHKAPSSSTSLQLMMTACDAIQGTQVAQEIASNPKRCLQVFEDAFGNKESDTTNNTSDSIVDDNIKILINTNNISKLLRINNNNDTSNISTDSLISIINSNNFHHNHQQLVQHMITYHNINSNNSNDNDHEFVKLLIAKLLPYIVFSSNDNSDINDDDIERASCSWAYVTVMSIDNDISGSFSKIISTLHLLAIDNPTSAFLCMGYLGYWGVRLHCNDYDDNSMTLLIQAISSLLSAYLQSIHIKGTSDPRIDIETLILSPVLLYSWLCKLNGNSSSLTGLKELLLRFLLVIAQSSANVWSTLLTMLKDTDSIKIDKDVTNRGYEIVKKGLKELLNWFGSKAGLLDSACSAMTDAIMPTIQSTTAKTKKNKKGQDKTSDIKPNKDKDTVDGDDDDDDEDANEPLSFSIDNTGDVSILKTLENDENYKNEVPNEMEGELNKADKVNQNKDKKSKKKSSSNDNGNDKKKRKVI